jgi:gamma-glutamyltranspeptidase/glutathione hydrolase
MLKMMDQLGKLGDDPDSAERHHVMLEVARLAYAMRDEFVADPDMADVPMDHMLDDGVIAELVSRVDPARARPDLGPMPQPKGSDTVYLSVVDENGMAVSFINSLFSDFGAGIATDKTGIMLQNRGQGFVVEPGHRNCVAPRKRPLHTLIPALAMKDGQLAMSFGVMGGAYQPAGHAHVLANMFDYGMRHSMPSACSSTATRCWSRRRLRKSCAQASSPKATTSANAASPGAAARLSRSTTKAL